MMRTLWIPAGLALLLVAALWLVLVGPSVGRLGSGFQSRYDFDAKARSRDSVDGPWTSLRLIGRRVDAMLVATDERMVLQSDVIWALGDGSLLFENAGVYAVDRRTRRNLPGLGSSSRTGQFMFPPNVRRRDYMLWDAQFMGPRTMRFRRREVLGGLTAYRFDFEVRAIDETQGYRHLADVPERYRAHTDGHGRLWVEPRSGLILDYVEHGLSFFARPDGSAASAFFEWDARFTAATRAAQVARAATARRRMLLAGIVLPAATAAFGLALLAAGLLMRRRLAA
ncbi:porin PorA family protein [Lysobacter humi (ex Lee et al. 2017)]